MVLKTMQEPSDIPAVTPPEIIPVPESDAKLRRRAESAFPDSFFLPNTSTRTPEQRRVFGVLWKRLTDSSQVIYDNFSNSTELSSMSVQAQRITNATLSAFIHDKEQLLSFVTCWNRAENYLAHRATRLSALAISLAAIHGLDKKNIIAIGEAALLSDIGLYPLVEGEGGRNLDQLSAGAYREHPQRAESALQSVLANDDPVLQLVVDSHERTDGNGFPKGKGRHLSEGAQLISLCNFYLPESHNRSLNPNEQLVRTYREAAQGAFSTGLAQSLVRLLSTYPIGSFVQLSGKRKARVLASHPTRADRPFVAMLTDEFYQVLSPDHFVRMDLAAPEFEGEAIEKALPNDALRLNPQIGF
jgi:HD-GYP domain-containing protein (c-di-GMP phosphodiesterase class II)